MFRTQWNYQQEEGEVNDMPSETIPNQSKSIAEIYRLYASGQPISTNPNLDYTGDEFVPNFEFMDPVERDAYIEKVAQLKKSIDERQAEKKQKEAEEKEASEKNKFEELYKKYGVNTPDPTQTAAPGGANA